jgi:hypothetical protein
MYCSLVAKSSTSAFERQLTTLFRIFPATLTKVRFPDWASVIESSILGRVADDQILALADVAARPNFRCLSAVRSFRDMQRRGSLLRRTIMTRKPVLERSE